MAEDAQFSMKEPALGLVPDLTGTKPLVEALATRALEICATARMVGAEEAVDIGLAADRRPRRPSSTPTVADLAAALTAPMRGVVTETKALLQGAAERTSTSSGGSSGRRRYAGSASWRR